MIFENVNQQQLLTILLIAAVVIVAMFVIIWQQLRIRRLQEAAKPKYGFLGKPLYSFFVVALLVGGFGITYYAVQNAQDVRVSADKNLELNIETEIISSTASSAVVRFALLPKVNDELWGGPSGGLFDIFWTVTGPENFSEVELEASYYEISDVEKTLDHGDYLLQVAVVYDGKTYSKETQATF